MLARNVLLIWAWRRVIEWWWMKAQMGDSLSIMSISMFWAVGRWTGLRVKHVLRIIFPSWAVISFASSNMLNSTLIFPCVWTDWGNHLKNPYIINNIVAWSEFCIWFIMKKYMLGCMKVEFIIWEVSCFFLPKEDATSVHYYNGVTGLWRQVTRVHKFSFSLEISL